LLRNFTGDFSAQVKSGPDVFADALVPSAAVDTGALISPHSLLRCRGVRVWKRVHAGFIAIAKPPFKFGRS
jgi:hypothetical protein